jgi:DNA-binding CsgD family transcriptional regulator
VFLTERSMLTNAAADRLVEPQDELLLRNCANRLADAAPGDPSHMVLSAGTEVTVRSDPISESGLVVGSVLRLTPTTRARAGSRAMRGAAAFGWECITDTERSVIDLVAQGFSNREAAERLFLSHHTVGFHLRSIYRKLAVSSRVDLTRIAVQHASGRAPALVGSSSWQE